MAEPYQKNGTWYARIKDHNGRWRGVALNARGKTEARFLSAELQRKSDRVRMGIDEAPLEDGGGTVAELFEWWLETYSEGTPSHSRNTSFVRAHFIEGSLAAVKLVELTPHDIDRFLKEKESTLAPRSLNHLRRYLVTAFNKAIHAERFRGRNPAQAVRARRVPKRVPD